ncbi:AAA family ATPase [Clostridium sp. C1]|uniref:KAP family P-loop NTPase fold protein n=1 Tax=Clostridium sp. C1 TaxID=1155388 RepID=UPI001BA484B6|nr:P-loop NTPase fold protein [Clostridium sp. C1]QUN13593.1 AAA family ATPase [Clostridium sp. C1]
MDEKIIDILHRDIAVSNIIEVVETMKKYPNNGFILIDGEWGSGKTTLLKLLKKEIKNDNNVIEYNCWENSFYTDPLIAIVSTVTEQFNKFYDINEIGLKLMNYIGFNMPTFSYQGINIDLKKNNPNDEYVSLESYIRKFKSTISNFNKHNFSIENKKTRIILVDELDRCLPEYAIKVLERLYLLFKGANNVIVIIAADKDQLENSIKTIFGSDFDMNRYLKKFIDFTYDLNYGVVNDNNVLERFQNYFNLFETNNYNDVINLISYFIPKGNIRETVSRIDDIMRFHNICFKEHNEYYICIFELLLFSIDKKTFKEIYNNVSSTLNKFSVKYKDSMQKELCKNIIDLCDRFYRSGNKLDDIQKGYQLYLQYLYHKDVIDDNFKNVIERFFNNYILNIENENMEIINSIHEYLIQKNNG